MHAGHFGNMYGILHFERDCLGADGTRGGGGSPLRALASI